MCYKYCCLTLVTEGADFINSYVRRHLIEKKTSVYLEKYSEFFASAISVRKSLLCSNNEGVILVYKSINHLTNQSINK